MRSSMQLDLYRDFFPTYADLFYRNAILIMKLSNLTTFRAIRVLLLHNQRLKNKQYFSLLLSYCYLYLILHKFWSVFDM